jgi:5S rRNA maturation endonuclease (ribonuclease M5)
VNPTHEAPIEKWQESARAFVDYSVNQLWSEQGQGALDYLRSRGLKDETIKVAQLGYNPAEMKRPGERWGRKGKITLQQGIVIPWILGANEIWRITIRDETVAEGDSRYKQVAGGSNGLYFGFLLSYDRPVIIVEGEFDALSIAQEAGHDVSVVATGSTEGSHTARWIAALARKDMVLVAFDAEEKGDKAAQWWLDRLENAHRLRPWWNDANQMLQDGIDLLNDWIVPRVESIVYGPTPIPTPDDRLRCHTCQRLFPNFEGWEPENIPMDAPSPSYDPIEGQPYCKQCRPDLFESDVLEVAS